MISCKVSQFLKNSRFLFVSVKLTIICYLTIFTVSYLTTDTAAYLTKTEVILQSVQTGTWDTEPEEDELNLVCTEEIDTIQTESLTAYEECNIEEDVVSEEPTDDINEPLDDETTTDEELDNPDITTPEPDSETNEEKEQENPSNDNGTTPVVTEPPSNENEEQKPVDKNPTEQNAPQDEKVETAPTNTDNKKVEGEENEETESTEMDK